MTDLQGRFVTPSPAEPDHELLFRTRPDFVLNLKGIAYHIAHSTPAERSSMTFALYGGWGAGKSTALRYLEALVSGTVDQDQIELSTTYFDAPLWERHDDTRAVLAFQILRGAKPDLVTNVAHTLAEIRTQSLSGVPAATNSTFELKRAIDFFDILSKYHGAPPLLEQWLREELRATSHAGRHPVHVIFVDDLDRCSPEFTVRLLASMSYWNSTPGISMFFVLAANREHLLASLASVDFPLGPRQPAEALEKYVHLSVDMPDFLTKSIEVADYICKMIAQVTRDTPGSDESHTAQFIEMLKNSARAVQPNSVFAPMLHPSSGKLTPRAVKHRLNTFMAEFKPEGRLDERLVKRWMIKAFWPDFWWKTLWEIESDSPAARPDVQRAGEHVQASASRNYVLALQQIGRELLPLWGMPHDSLSAPMRHLAQKNSRMLLGNEDPALAIYLAASPEWESLSAEEDRRRAPALNLPMESDEPLSEEAARLADAAADNEIVPPELSADDKIVLHFLYASRAEARIDRDGARNHLRQLLKIATAAAVVSSRGSTIGNAAVIAERLADVPLALQLYKLAIATDPTMSTTVRNYVTTVITEELVSEYDNAERALQELSTHEGQPPAFRTEALKVRFALLKGADHVTLKPAVQALHDRLASRPNREDFESFLNLAAATLSQSLVTSMQIRDVARAVAGALDNDEDRYKFLRAYARHLFMYPDPTDENEAARAFLYMLDMGLAGRFATPFAGAMLETDLSVLLENRGFHKAALALKLGAYPVRVSDLWLRRNLALALRTAGYEDLAPLAMLGQRIPEIDLDVEPVPRQVFGDSTNDWWRELGFASYEPGENLALKIIQ